MLIPSISHYLESHRRLVIPQLGAFLVKEPGHTVLFSELLKRDDGVLRGVLREAGMSDLEAAGEIDRFVFEVRHAIQGGAAYPLKGLGTLKPGPNGTIAFVYDPTPVEEFPAGASGSGDTRPAAAAEPEASASAPGEHAATEHAATVTATTATMPSAKPAAEEHGSEMPGGEQPRKRTPRIPADQLARSVERAFAEPYVSPSAKMNPDPSVRGLRYGKPPKTTDAYTYVDRPPRRRADRFLWIAIAAALIALAAIGFGYWREHRDQQAAEAEYLEYRQMINTPNTSLEAAAAEGDPAQAEQAE